MMNRRNFYRIGTNVLGAILTLVLAVPGMAYLLDPLRKKAKSGEFRDLPVRLSELPVGEPRRFTIVDEVQDAWVKYPDEPVGSVWLIRQPEGTKPEVVAFTAECPHLGGAVNLSPNGKSFFCPFHNSAFTFDGTPTNKIPPRPMDTLDVELGIQADPSIRVKFQRFRSQSEEKIPLV